MKEELTDEMIEEMDCRGIGWFMAHDKSRIYDEYKVLVHALQAERAKPKVWEQAPEGADEVELYFRKQDEGYFDSVPVITYIRTLPKTRAREIAEEGEEKYKHGFGAIRDVIEACIQKREAELKEAGE